MSEQRGRGGVIGEAEENKLDFADVPPEQDLLSHILVTYDHYNIHPILSTRIPL